MSEINNNYGFKKIDKIEKIEKIEKPANQNNEEKPAVENNKPNYVQDTGVLGRSLVKDAGHTDITKSVDEAVALALNHPDILEGGESMFTAIYNDCMKKGMGPLEAYYIGSEAIKEFAEISRAHKAEKAKKND